MCSQACPGTCNSSRPRSRFLTPLLEAHLHPHPLSLVLGPLQLHPSLSLSPVAVSSLPSISLSLPISPSVLSPVSLFPLLLVQPQSSPPPAAVPPSVLFIWLLQPLLPSFLVHVWHAQPWVIHGCRHWKTWVLIWWVVVVAKKKIYVPLMPHNIFNQPSRDYPVGLRVRPKGGNTVIYPIFVKSISSAYPIAPVPVCYAFEYSRINPRI